MEVPKPPQSLGEGATWKIEYKPSTNELIVKSGNTIFYPEYKENSTSGGDTDGKQNSDGQ